MNSALEDKARQKAIDPADRATRLEPCNSKASIQCAWAKLSVAH